MRSFLSEKRSVFKMVIVLIAPASVLSISITCFIVREVISRHDDEMVKVIAAEINDDIGNELLKAVMVSRGMANDTFMHQSLKTENDYTTEEYTEIMTAWLRATKERLNYSAALAGRVRQPQNQRRRQACFGHLRRRDQHAQSAEDVGARRKGI